MNIDVGKLLAHLGLDTSEFRKGIDDSKKAADTGAKAIAKSLDAVGDKLISVGKKMTTFVTLPLIGLGTAAVKAASDLNESINAVNVVFGESGKQITDWSRTAASEVGLTASDIN